MCACPIAASFGTLKMLHLSGRAEYHDEPVRCGWSSRGLVFATRLGTSISPNNVLRRYVFPACQRLGLRHATWLTFRRTYSSWSHDKGVPGKVVARLMGHANVDTTLNVYTQVLDGSVRDAVAKVGGELFTMVHKPEEEDSGTAA